MSKKGNGRGGTDGEGIEYADLAHRVYDVLSALNPFDKLHLTSVAKVIEVSREHRVRIIFREVTREILGPMFPAFLVTQDLVALVPGGGTKMEVREHVILYVDNKRDPEKTRFCLGHELGHIAIHEKLFDDPSRRVLVPPSHYKRMRQQPGEGKFAIEFKDREEMEADLFAAALVHQRPVPSGRKPFEMPCLREVRDMAQPRKKLCYSRIYSVVKSIRLSCQDCNRFPQA